MTILQALGLLAVGTVAGFDLVSGPQILLARPIVAGTLSGLILGDVASGILVGGILELFALEVLPVGATRYPDHGPGAVAAVWLTTVSGPVVAGVAVLVALVTSEIGGWSLQRHRRLNARALAAVAPALDRGDRGVAAQLQFGGAVRDAARSLVVTSAGLLLARGARLLTWWPPETLRLVTVVVLGAALAGAVAGAIRTAGQTRRGLLLALALVVGWVAAGAVGVFPRGAF